MINMYKKMYLTLFNVLTDAIEALDEGKYAKAERILKEAQRAAELVYMEGEEE